MQTNSETPKTNFEKDLGKISALDEISSKAQTAALPTTYKYGREAILQLRRVDRTLFSDIQEKESGNYIVSGIERQVSELDFEALKLAMAQILYNQSYQFGHTEKNTGVSEKKAKRLSAQTGNEYFSGEVVTSLTEICRLGYGVEPNGVQKEAMKALLDTLHSTPVHITFPNGDTADITLCATMSKYIRKADGAVMYQLFLHPIFCSNVAKNFAELPQNITKQLSAITKRKTPAHYKLITLLTSQDKRKPFYRNIDTLLYELNLEDTYRINPSRTEKQLKALFDTMVKLDIITHYDVETTKVRQRTAISKVTFYLNPNYLRDGKDQTSSNEQQP